MKDIKECTKVVLHNFKFEEMEEQDSVWDKERKMLFQMMTGRSMKYPAQIL